MDVQEVLHMVGGEGETSYAVNSTFQKTGTTIAMKVVLEGIMKVYNSTLPQCLCIADLGCSSGTNSLLVLTQIIDTIESVRNRLGHPLLEYQVALNDLTGNDFNTIFKSLPALYERLKKKKGERFGPCFISGLPGSFIGRLFPCNTIHFVHSSYSVHWLSQVPIGPEDNKGQIYLAKTSSSSVRKAYLEQFQKDFSVFLRSRYDELVPGGHMVMTMLGSKSEDPFSRDFCTLMELLAKSLKDLVSKEGRSNHQEIFDVNWDPNDDNHNEGFMFDNISSARNAVRCVRAVTESMFVHQFGEAIIDNLYQRYTEIIAEHLSKENAREKSKYVSLLISLKRK
ncbi:S-adenosyl-L-methionine:benzoic acid/salicylic acid carboxyl methyltransferase 3-like [Macadamia integrifolia]|uniref:S-adenosyl-L-methionine:benzoic acid/salicylic acid carboxyl methyltransferase 3-like n=1 Tax=Macadamia integrifolia TaxID=60698 RepID=UPI001C4EA566|nr:S-adenosyl-L-methionine:benzoic acid/salicylic acid carboxyl methyltransferase 3-like [Macadamia integrifolia]